MEGRAGIALQGEGRDVSGVGRANCSRLGMRL